MVRCAMHADAFSPKQGCISRSKNPNTESLNHVAKKVCPFSLLHFMSCIIYVLFLLCIKGCFLRKAKGKVSETAIQTFPSQNDTTAHLPVQAHLRHSEPPPPGVSRSLSSSPGGRPTTVSALQVRNARTRRPDLGPKGPMAVMNGVVGSHAAWRREIRC